MFTETAPLSLSATSTRTATRVLTGDRPTGSLHLGHYFGTLANRVALQRAGHDLLIVIADYQVMTDRDHPGDLGRVVRDIVLDYLACGLDPDATTVFVHSAVPALNQLMLPFLSLVGMGELSRNPTVKEEIRLSGRSSVSGLMMTYPVHQAADVLFCKADLVPVGKDQLPHLEVTRSIARRFNERYGPVFPLPEALLGETPVLLGLDGRKMGKSLGNGISLRDEADDVVAKIRAARTDSERRITFEPDRRPEVANLLRIGGLCAGRDPVELADEVGDGGASVLKRAVVDSVNAFLDPIRARRSLYEPADASALLRRGAGRASELAERTLDEVRDAMGMRYDALG
ncbi:MAG TPA: tryptophan--tRNA ligase [Jatrophihabitantaceae bacterium]|jgi:tryptophanyl-tRNA synthetase